MPRPRASSRWGRSWRESRWWIGSTRRVCGRAPGSTSTAAGGPVELPGVRATPVVTAVLRNRGRILIVRRSEKVGSFRGRWSAISGHLEGREDPKDRAVQEVREETGLQRLSFRAARAPILARHDATMYVVHPFLFDVASRRVRLDWENVEHRWVRNAEELDRFQTVPRLKDVVAAVLH